MTLDKGVLSNRPPSQYSCSAPLSGDGAAVGGKLGGKLPLARTCAGSICMSLLSNRSNLPVSKFVAAGQLHIGYFPPPTAACNGSRGIHGSGKEASRAEERRPNDKRHDEASSGQGEW